MKFFVIFRSQETRVIWQILKVWVLKTLFRLRNKAKIFQVGDFDCCNLSLQICKDPVVTPEGIIYEREAILNYMVEQKAKIAATKKRKLKEEKEKEEGVPEKVFKVRKIVSPFQL